MKFKLVKLITCLLYQTGCALKASGNKYVFSLHLRKQKALVVAVVGVVGLVAVVRVLGVVHVVAV